MISFRDILQKYHVPFRSEGHEHCRPGWLQLDCPTCGQRGHFRMGYNLRGKYLNCWSCGYRPLVDTLVSLTKAPWRELRALLGDVIKEREADTRRRPGKVIIPKGVEDFRDAHRRYLEDRGIDADAAANIWQAKGIGPFGVHRWTIFIPIHLYGEVVSWTTRRIAKHGKRYRSAAFEQEIISAKELLYGEDFLRHAVICCEGPIDVWRIGPGAVATLGTAYTPSQVLRLSKYPRRVICFDSVDDAQRQARALCDQLAGFPGETYNVVLDAKDAGEASESEIRELRQRFLLQA